MIEGLSQEKFIIWRTKKGSIDFVIIAIFIMVLLILPLFKFFVSAFSTIDMVYKTKETLEIATISTYTKINQESLGMGVIEIDESQAKAIFNQQVNELVLDNSSLRTLKDAFVSININDGKIHIVSNASIMSAFNRRIQVGNSLGFIINPIMEDS